MLSYIYDTIVLSGTFEKHLVDLTTVFDRLLEFKLRENREKYHFAYFRVKYLGFWITKFGREGYHVKLQQSSRWLLLEMSSKFNPFCSLARGTDDGSFPIFQTLLFL